MIESDFEVRLWSEQEFKAGRDDWQRLLASSNADKLFLSWAWMYSWWQLWARSGIDELYLQAAYYQGELVGIAPCYIEKTHYFAKLLPIKRLHFIGHRHSRGGGLRSEYLGPIVRSDLEASVSVLLAEAIFCNPRWDEAILSDLVREDVFHRLLKDQSRLNNYPIRVLGASICYSVNAIDKFDKYKEKRGRNTRLKLFGRRKLLAEYGRVELVSGDSVDVGTVMDSIDEFHHIRFKSTTFTDRRRALVRRLVSNGSGSDIQCTSSLLQLDGETLSAMLNLSVAGKVYNIQLGYVENFDKKISLGTLHLGYAIEEAFNNPGIHSFDFLAGEGKNSDYKKRLAELESTLESIMVIRNPVLKIAYRFNDWLKELSKKKAVAKTA